MIPRSNEIDNNFQWEEIRSLKPVKLNPNEIQVSYGKSYSGENEAKIPLLTFRLGEEIMQHLRVTIGDRLIVLHDKNDLFNYLLMKSPNGYKIGADPIKKVGRINFRYKRAGLSPFKGTLCETFLNKNNTIRVTIPSILE